MVWLTLFLSLFTTIAGSAALGASLGVTAFAVFYLFAPAALPLAVQSVYNTLNSFTLSAVPMFIILGELLVASGLSSRIYTAIAPVFRRVPGRLLHTNIAVCTLFGAVSGSSTATAAAVGAAAYPELTKRNYDRPAILGSLAAGGTLGLLIPPSLSLIIYGAWQEVSIGKLFLAGILPGLMIACLFMLYILVRGIFRPDLTPAEAGPAPRMIVLLVGLLQLWPLIILIGAVLGTIYLGLATPTEAAGLGVAATLLIGFLFGDLTIARCWEATLRSVIVFGALFFVVIGAVLLGQAISILGLPREAVLYVSSLGLGKDEVLLAVIVLYIVLGCFFDGIALMLMTLPFIFPLLVHDYGFDAVWLGVFITIMIEIGMITPPVGINLFVLAAITRQEVPFGQIARAAIPYWLLMILATGLLVAFPTIALWLPSLFL